MEAINTKEVDPSEDTSLFALSWNYFDENLKAAFDNPESLRKYSDVTFLCEDRTLYAHRIILHASSDYFRDLFEDQRANNNLIIYMFHVKGVVLMKLLEYMYTGEIQIEKNYLPELIMLGQNLKVKGLVNVNKLNAHLDVKCHDVTPGHSKAKIHSPIKRKNVEVKAVIHAKSAKHVKHVTASEEDDERAEETSGKRNSNLKLGRNSDRFAQKQMENVHIVATTEVNVHEENDETDEDEKKLLPSQYFEPSCSYVPNVEPSCSYVPSQIESHFNLENKSHNTCAAEVDFFTSEIGFEQGNTIQPLDTNDSDTTFTEENVTKTSKQAAKGRRRYRTKMTQQAHNLRKHPMLPSCECRRFKCFDNFTVEDREHIHTSYWQLDKSQRILWLAEKIVETPAKRKIVGESKRNNSRMFYMPCKKQVNSDCNFVETKRVCKAFFAATLGYGNTAFVLTALKRKREGYSPSTRKSAYNPNGELIESHIRSFNPRPSRYRRSHAPEEK